MAELLARTGRDAGRRFPLTDDVTKVGRSTENDAALTDAALTDASVSRFHAHLLRRADCYYIRDVGSAVGTLVNGERVAGEVALDDADLICVGQTELIFGIAEAKEPEPEAPSPPEAVFGPEWSAPPT